MVKQEGRLRSDHVGLLSPRRGFGVYSHCSRAPWENFVQERSLIRILHGEDHSDCMENRLYGARMEVITEAVVGSVAER